jgi:hypothetical protein
MQTKQFNQLISEIPVEERKLEDFREIPCKDMDLDCFAQDGIIPFGSYRCCYEYAPELGKCIFYEWKKKKESA